MQILRICIYLLIRAENWAYIIRRSADTWLRNSAQVLKLQHETVAAGAMIVLAHTYMKIRDNLIIT